MSIHLYNILRRIYFIICTFIHTSWYGLQNKLSQTQGKCTYGLHITLVLHMRNTLTISKYMHCQQFILQQYQYVHKHQMYTILFQKSRLLGSWEVFAIPPFQNNKIHYSFSCIFQNHPILQKLHRPYVLIVFLALSLCLQDLSLMYAIYLFLLGISSTSLHYYFSSLSAHLPLF